MSQTKIQFFAKVLTYSRPEGLPDGQLVFVVEYIAFHFGSDNPHPGFFQVD